MKSAPKRPLSIVLILGLALLSCYETVCGQSAVADQPLPDVVAGEGSVGQAETVTDVQWIQQATQLLRLHDANRDTVLERDEFERLSPDWLVCDLDENSQLDVAELACGLKFQLASGKVQVGGGVRSAAAQFRVAHSNWQTQLQQVKIQTGIKVVLDGGDVDESKRNAEAFVALNDRNSNGVLDSVEWSAVSDTWKEVDYDRNGVLTVAEVQVRFQSFAKQAATPLDGSLIGSRSIQRPVSDLPKEFEKRDVNGNGQVEMHEFADAFDAAKVREYYVYDKNRDGLITSGEWLSIIAKRNGDASKAKEAKTSP